MFYKIGNNSTISFSNNYVKITLLKGDNIMSNFKIEKLESIGSTNAYAIKNIDSLEDKHVIATKHQTAGKGRQGRTWLSDGSSNAYVSIVLKPNKLLKNYPYSNLTQYASVIICKVLEKKYNLSPTIKWPNDILVDGAKIAGILCEAINKNNNIDALILGFGVNLNMQLNTLLAIDQKATSLNLLTEKTIDADGFIEDVLSEFFENYENFINIGFPYIKKEYKEKTNFIGKETKIRTTGGIKEYLIIGINNDGTLEAKDENGHQIKILTGDILI